MRFILQTGFRSLQSPQLLSFSPGPPEKAFYNKKFLEVSEPFFKKVLTRRRQFFYFIKRLKIFLKSFFSNPASSPPISREARKTDTM